MKNIKLACLKSTAWWTARRTCNSVDTQNMFRLGDEMKTAVVRQEDEEAKENEPRPRDVEEQEEEGQTGWLGMREGRLSQRRAEHSGLA
jgi:hypothetical protein